MSACQCVRRSRVCVCSDGHAHPHTGLCVFINGVTEMDSVVLTSAASDQVSAGGDE